jgi:uncharacterized protein (DUF1800 family)
MFGSSEKAIQQLLFAGVCIGILASLSAVCQARDTGDFQIRGDYSGPLYGLNLNAVITPATVDQSNAGNLYVAAVYGSSIVFLTPSGWTTWAGGPFPSYLTGPLSQTSVPVSVNYDVSGLQCLLVFAGYGRDQQDMILNQTYGSIYQIPASRTLTSPLPCSTSQDADIARFLEQASFGPSDQAIAAVKQLGINGWLSQQFNTPATGYGDFPYFPGTAPPACDSICQRDNYSLFQMQRTFFQNAIAAPDQLRQRVAFALQQILVVSGLSNNLAYANAEYQNLLLNLAFSNFETILTEVTLNPTMGRYLDMVNNGKAISANDQANENYARELLQLFSIGLYQLNQDGSMQSDSTGRPLPTYDEDVIKGFARVFTGWTYPPQPGAISQRYNLPYYKGRMVVDPTNHDTGSKSLLNGAVLAAGQTPDKDLADAVHLIFTHPNVGPFIGKQLIQKLVTSNPSPAYINRVAAAFADNGQGVRGDMKAVIRAILLDPEARGGMKQDPVYGHLKEPVLFISHLMRALGGNSDGVFLRTQSAGMQQNVMMAPSVFNFYPPDFMLQSGLLAPEFGIHDANAAFACANFVYQLVYGNGAAADSAVPGSTGTRLDLTPFAALASDPAGLVDRLDVLLTHGTLSPSARTSIINAVAALSNSDRAKFAIYLLATSSQFQVEQ